MTAAREDPACYLSQRPTSCTGSGEQVTTRLTRNAAVHDDRIRKFLNLLFVSRAILHWADVIHLKRISRVLEAREQ
jgi:hypothetical protein